jgi:hypothetical protein
MTDEAKVEVKSKRKPAPDVHISEDWADERLKIEEAYDLSDSGSKHIWVPAEAKPEVLTSRNAEVVEKDGKPIRWGGDFLCRIPRESFDRKRKRESDMSESVVRRLYGERKAEDMIKFASPKVPKKLKKETEDG